MLKVPHFGIDLRWDHFFAVWRRKVVAEKLLLELFLIGWTFFPSQIMPQKRWNLQKFNFINRNVPKSRNPEFDQIRHTRKIR